MIFTVITSRRCPCENCAGTEVEDPDVQDFASLREALQTFDARHGMDHCEGFSCSSSECGEGDWWALLDRPDTTRKPLVVNRSPWRCLYTSLEKPPCPLAFACIGFCADTTIRPLKRRNTS